MTASACARWVSDELTDRFDLSLRLLWSMDGASAEPVKLAFVWVLWNCVRVLLFCSRGKACKKGGVRKASLNFETLEADSRVC